MPYGSDAARTMRAAGLPGSRKGTAGGRWTGLNGGSWSMPSHILPPNTLPGSWEVVPTDQLAHGRRHSEPTCRAVAAVAAPI
eukprot:14513538-Alexandrium_andersonii.AAC.1